MTSPAITPADIDSLKELAENATPGPDYDHDAYCLVVNLKTTKALIARVVELEAEVAELKEADRHHHEDKVSAGKSAILWQSRAEASEARATALLEALRPFARAADGYDMLTEPQSDDLYVCGLVSASPGYFADVKVAYFRAARAAILQHSGDQNDRK